MYMGVIEALIFATLIYLVHAVRSYLPSYIKQKAENLAQKAIGGINSMAFRFMLSSMVVHDLKTAVESRFRNRLHHPG